MSPPTRNTTADPAPFPRVVSQDRRCSAEMFALLRYLKALERLILPQAPSKTRRI